MKSIISFVLVIVLVFGMAGCGNNPAAKNSSPADTQPANTVGSTAQDTQPEQPPQLPPETEPTQTVTEATEPDPYEQYIRSVRKGEYRYEDLSGDGNPELIIYRKNSESEILTLADGKAVVILSAHHMFFCEGGIIGRFSEGSGGVTLFFYRIIQQEAVITDVLVKKSQDGSWYRGTDTAEQNLTRISENDALKLREQYVLLDESVPWFLTWFYPEDE